jgi:hypothetical protein
VPTEGSIRVPADPPPAGGLRFTLIAAIAFHGAVLLVASKLPPLALLLPSDQRPMDKPVDIDLTPELVAEMQKLEPLPAADTAAEPAPRTPSAERPLDTRPAARVATPTGPVATGTPAVEPTGPTSPPNPEAPAPTKPQWDDLPPERGGTGVLGVPGVGGPSVWAMPGVLPSAAAAAAPAPTVTPAARPVDSDVAGRVVRDMMATRDKALGLDSPAAGTVASAVGVAIRSSDVPNVARGTLEIRLGPSGEVLSVRVVSMSGGSSDQWARAAAAVKASLAGRGLTLSSEYAKGATVTVSVVSNDQPPAGSKGGFTGTGASFDLSNLGAHTARHVRTSFSISAAR